MLGKNYYEILQVTKSASISQIKKAFRKLAKIYHPDKNGGDASSEEKFKLLYEAYETLIDAKKRMEYDDKVFKVETNPAFQNNVFNNDTSRNFYFSPQQFFSAVVFVLLFFIGLIFLAGKNNDSK